MTKKIASLYPLSSSQVARRLRCMAIHRPSSSSRGRRFLSVVAIQFLSIFLTISSSMLVVFSLIDNILADGLYKAQGGGLLSMLPMLILLMAFMYFMVIRPQTKRAKEHKNLMGNLQVGDEVVTVGGILGTIDKIADNFVILVVANDSKVTIQKGAVATILPRGTIKGITNK